MADVLLVNRKAAARLLGLSVRTVWTLTNTGAIPVVRIGRAVRYRPADLAAWVDANVRREQAGRPIRLNPAC